MISRFPIFEDDDFVRLIKDELIRYPDSCLATNLNAWYNALYSASFYDRTCAYQVQINENLCPTSEPETIGDAVGLLVALVQGDTRAVARQTLRVICRQAQRQTTLRTAPNP